MKKSFLVVAVTWVVTSSIAHAVILPFETEYPMLRAKMHEVSAAEGSDADSLGSDQVLTLIGENGSAKGFEFSESRKVICVVAPCNPVRNTVRYNIQQVSKDSCGSTVYHGVAVREQGNQFLRPQTIEVSDHQTRLCEDYRPYRWEASITTLIPTPPPTLAFRHYTRKFAGNPEPVYRILNEVFLP